MWQWNMVLPLKSAKWINRYQRSLAHCPALISFQP